MPGLNGTGPMGAGSRTGRGMGRCRPADASYGAANWTGGMGRGMGRGMGFGAGMGRFLGRGRGMYPYYANTDVYSNTDEYERYLESELDAIRNRKQGMTQRED